LRQNVPTMKHLSALDALFLHLETPETPMDLTNPAAAWYAVADRLAQHEAEWRPYHRDGWRSWLYRDPYRAGDLG